MRVLVICASPASRAVFRDESDQVGEAREDDRKAVALHAGPDNHADAGGGPVSALSIFSRMFCSQYVLSRPSAVAMT